MFGNKSKKTLTKSQAQVEIKETLCKLSSQPKNYES